MPTLGYQVPTKRNSVAKGTFPIFGEGLSPNQQVNWSIILTGQIEITLSGSATADANGVVNETISNPMLEDYNSNPDLPQLSGGIWSGDHASFSASASNGSQTIEISAQLV